MSGAYQQFGVPDTVVAMAREAERIVADRVAEILRVREVNQLRVIAAMQRARLSDSHFLSGSGYGYGDIGRERLDQAFAEIFGAEHAMVRTQISSGTQAIVLCLSGVLRPGDVLLSVTGAPYDTLSGAIGLTGDLPGSLREYGIQYRQVDLLSDGTPDTDGIRESLDASVRMVFVQKSRGYASRRALLNRDIRQIADTVRAAGSDAVIMVDNCYGEFVEETEPCMAGADLCAGSLIKNPGGGLCLSGGYVAGRRDLVELAAARLTAPGQGSHVGPTLGFTRTVAQGLFLAPHTVAEALRGAVTAAALFEAAGYDSSPGPYAARGDIVQTVTFGSPNPMIRFCKAVQAASPVDGFVTPEPWAMPGYDDPVIMAAGTFVQGASIELSADGPIRPPYTAYMQGGLVYENILLACLMALSGPQGAAE